MAPLCACVCVCACTFTSDVREGKCKDIFMQVCVSVCLWAESNKWQGKMQSD